MASLIPGYEYDIFISYRQKDNKGDRWVSRFVDLLKAELEATFKEDVTVYFDENPHDRLQETHNVSKSLEGKLKCLVFIPVLSQTYCDPGSYAWQYEFKAFNEAAKADRFGIDIRLKNGNFSSRILPVRIHDLEPEDINLFEKETGSVLRSLDFVFRTASGVNRPLKPDEDHPNDNLAKTYFSDQINKVANAIKEIIQGMQTKSGSADKEILRETKTSSGQAAGEQVKKRKIASKIPRRALFGIAGAFLIVMILASLFVFTDLFKRNKSDKINSSGGRITVAVMPFQNNTNDAAKNFWQKMIQDNIITFLSGSGSDEIKIRQSESISGLLHSKRITDFSSLTTTAASNISKELNAAIFIIGSINQSGTKVRLNAQLIDSRSEEVIKAFQKEGLENVILNVIDSLSLQIADFLILSNLKQNTGPDERRFETTSSPKAYEYYISGYEAFSKSDFKSARDLFSEALKCDSNYTLASVWLAVTYLNLTAYDKGRSCITNAYNKRDQMSKYMRIKVEDVYAWYKTGPAGRIKYLKQLIEFDDQDPASFQSLGNAYYLTDQFDNAVAEYEKAFAIYDKWKTTPAGSALYVRLGTSYHKTGQYSKEKKLYRKAELVFPGDRSLMRGQIILAFSGKDTVAANSLIDKYISSRRVNQVSETTISSELAGIYNEAKIPEKAEKYYRLALDLMPGDIYKMNELAFFLIDSEINVDEGIKLADITLESDPSSYHFLNTKGWGLFKKGKYREALDILQKGWDLRMQNAIYNHESYKRLEKAKRAVSGQGNS